MLRVRLVINVLDSSGLEGLIPCMRAIQTYRDYGLGVATAVLAQNNQQVFGLYPVPIEHLGAEIDAALEGYQPASVHVGLLPNEASADVIAAALQKAEVSNVILDPVMQTSLGLTVHEPERLEKIVDLFRGVTRVLTPNIPEAAVLCGHPLEDMNTVKEAAAEIFEKYKPEFLVIKGGHLESLPRAIDLIYDGKRSYLIDQPWQKGRRFAGIGDTYATLVAVLLSEGNDIHQAVDRAKRFVVRAMQHTFTIGAADGLQPLNHNIPKT